MSGPLHRFAAAGTALLLATTVLPLSSCSGDGFSACAAGTTCASGSGGGGDAGSSGSGEASGSGGASGAGRGGESGNSSGHGGSGNAGEAGTADAGTGGGGGAGGAPPCDGTCGGTTPACLAATNTCVECTDKSSCKSPKAACATATNKCVECTDKSTCSTPKPACDTTTKACVECTAKTDCTDSSKPLCDTTAEKCVACLQQSDCASATASACTAGACTACTVDAECSNIAGKGVCNAGTCVQCAVAKESVCAGNSCNPATNQCTTTPVGSLQFCQPCLADSECIGGNKTDPDTRCVSMKFMGTARPGGFCLRRVSKTCSPPFEVAISVASLSGAQSESYCGIDQNATRCEAVLDLVASKACPDGIDTSCGCARNKAGACIDSGLGGLCKTVGVNANSCTIPCALANQCPGTLTCPAAANSYCQ